MFDWVTYPIRAILTIAWEGIQNSKDTPSPYTVETIAALERTLAYAYTGSAKVISRAVMEPLFLSRGLLETGFPTLNQAIIAVRIENITHVPRLAVAAQSWPMATAYKGPAMCSNAAQKMYFSNMMVNVSIAVFSFLALYSLGRLRDDAVVIRIPLGRRRDDAVVIRIPLGRRRDDAVVVRIPLGRLRDDAVIFRIPLGRRRDDAVIFRNVLQSSRGHIHSLSPFSHNDSRRRQCNDVLSAQCFV
jgi:hypothetical protein